MTESISPSYYDKGGVECAVAIASAVGDAGYEGFLVGNILKYLWRYQDKNGLEDLQKAHWYLEELIDKVAIDEDEKEEHSSACLSDVVY